MKRAFQVAGIGLLALAAIAIVGAGILAVLSQTDWFKNKVRERIVSVAEQASGGRVEIGRFNYDWRALTAEVSPFVLHGTEPATAPPFFRAARIQIGLKLISAFRRKVDIASLEIDQPQVYIAVAPDGSTNVPAPKVRRGGKNPIQQLLDLKVGRFDVRDGAAELNLQRIPLDIHGDHLQAGLAFDASGPFFRGSLRSRQLRIGAPQFRLPMAFDLDTKFSLQANRIQILEASLSKAAWKVQLKGAVDNFASPRAAFDVAAVAPVEELKKTFGVPLEPRGEASFQGQASLHAGPFEYKVEGKVAGRGLGFSYQGVTIRGIGASSRIEVTAAKIRLPDLDLRALDGSFRGAAELVDYKKLSVRGVAQGLALKDLAQLKNQPTGELNGTLSGPVTLNAQVTRSGLANITTQAQLDLTPGTGGVPVQGAVAINYDQRAGTLQLGNSEVNLGSTHATFSGTLGRQLQVRVVSANLNDALPLFPLFQQTPPDQLPIALEGSSASFDGTVQGPLANPVVSGKAEIGRFAVDDHKFDRATATFELDRTSANLRTFTLAQGKMRVEGQGRVALQDWQVHDSSAISALLAVSGADIQTLAAESKIDTPVSGTFSGTLHVSGSIESPLASGSVEAVNVNAYGEHADTVRGDITYSANAVEISSGEVRSGTARIRGDVAYNHPANDWKDGSLRFDIGSAQLTLAQIKHVQDFRKGLSGQLDLKASGAAKVVAGVIDLTSLNGSASLRNAVVDGRRYGNIELTAATRLPMLTLRGTVNLPGVDIQGSGEWRMDGDYPGQARIQIPRVSFATLHDLAPGQHLRQELPFEGFLQGEATVAGPLNHPSAMKADVVLSTVQMSARPGPTAKAKAQARDLVIENAEPVRLEATTKAIEIRSANFKAKETSLKASGRLALDLKNPWDLKADGRINLAVLQIFNPDLLATGESIVNVSVRGPLTEPQVDGRLELQNASLFLKDFPNGVDQANGTILFDRNRATVQKLTAVTGGGNVTFEPGSFVGFRGPVLLYRLTASADNVRYRSQDGISVTVNAKLALVGTSENSVLSGTVTVARAAFNPRTDVGALLASTTKPVSVPSEPNQYLRGIQFDVRVESATSLEVQTSLTRNIQADASLRVRGTPERPVVLGNISVNSGQIEFFGNKYTINRGEVNFYNAVKVEPVIDMDLETQVRGISVDITFSGSLNKLNFSYRSDPPLETNDIIALLAVGRAPSTASPLATSQTSYLSTGSNALLGQAIAPVSGRLQKFFGVSHIKIDPQLTDVTSVPQARLTFEQQVSSDITLTYITNLAVANQQIVRVEWDLNKRWSVVALRDENGAFGIDFQYKKRFK